MTSPEVVFVVVDFNGLADTRKCLQSMEAADLRGAPVVVIDNGSHPPSADAIAGEFPWAKVIRRDENGGWSGGNNEGIRWALAIDARYIVLLNNDTVVAPNIVARLIAAANSHPEIGIMGPVINFMDEPDAIMTDGVVFNAPGPPGSMFTRKIVTPRLTKPPTVEKVDIVNGCALMVSAETLRRIGLIDDRFFLIHEEADLCLRAVAAGVGCGVLAETLVWHKGSSAFKKTGLRHQRYYDARNLILLLANHAASHRRGRSSWRAWFEYFRYIYYRWSIERESGETDAANSIVEGALDGVAGRWGPFQRRSRPMRHVVAALFRLIHRFQ
jgi:GT2 family glycosyltransferase